MTDVLNAGKIVQIAYFVPDVESAARRAHQMFGTGPFFIYHNIELTDVTYRGQPAELDHSSAYGQSGSLMIEFTQQNNVGPSAFTDMYPEGGEGIDDVVGGARSHIRGRLEAHGAREHRDLRV